MTRDEVIDLVLNRVGRRSGDTALRAEAEKEIKLAQIRVERRAEKPWFLTSETSDASTVANEPRLPVPSDFLMEIETAGLFLTKTDGKEVELVKDDYDALTGKYLNADAAQPVKYALRGGYFYFFPTPDAAYSLRMTYVKKGAELTSDITNVWLTYAPDLFIGELGAVIAGQYLKDKQGGAEFAELARSTWMNIMDETIAREEANLPSSMGDGH